MDSAKGHFVILSTIEFEIMIDMKMFGWTERFGNVQLTWPYLNDSISFHSDFLLLYHGMH